MRTGTLTIASLAILFFTACAASSSDAGAPAVDSGKADTTSADTGKVDAPGDGASDAAPEAKTDTGEADTTIGDTPVGITFPCGSETCSANFQYCKQTGSCVAPDAGADASDGDADDTATDAADGGACVRSCETLPSDCFGGASCACLLNNLCGSPSSGTCDEDPANAFTVECTP